MAQLISRCSNDGLESALEVANEVLHCGIPEYFLDIEESEVLHLGLNFHVANLQKSMRGIYRILKDHGVKV